MSLEHGKPINIGLIGFGNIGTGVVQYFQEGRGKPLNLHLLRVAVSDLSKPRTVAFSGLTDNPANIFNDPAIGIVVELMGGVDLARRYTLDAINQGKSVVSANKALYALHMKELFDAARLKKVNLGLEASVAGGIQILNTLQKLRGEKVYRIMGILNGTTNYILTRMEEGLDFDTALQQAQKRGFAEANHSLDTGGFDARDKLAVLASLVLNTQIDVEKIPVSGITGLTPIDIGYAREHGQVIKLLAIANIANHAVELRVAPALIKNTHPLAAARDEFNMIYLEGELAGPQTLYGRGAGVKPTTSAIISDILRIAENIRRDTPDQLPSLDSEIAYEDPSGVRQRGYVRVNLIDRPGSIHAVSRIIYRRGLNMKNSIQREESGFFQNGDQIMPDIITLDPAPRRVIDSALQGMKRSPRVYGKPFFLSFEE